MKKDILTALSMVTQFGITTVTPVLLCVWGALWLKNKFDLGDFTVVLGILIGIGASVMSMIKMIKQMSEMAKEDEE